MERDTAIPVQRAGAPYPRTPRAAPRTASPHPCSAVSAHAGPSAHVLPAGACTCATGRYGATAARITARGNSGAPLSLATGRAARCNASSAHAGPCEGIGVSETRARARDAVAARTGRPEGSCMCKQADTNIRSHEHGFVRTDVRRGIPILLVDMPPEFFGRFTCAEPT